MKTLTAALLASAFIASPALACGFGKTAEHKMGTVASLETVETSEEAMSTYDPAEKPIFEETSKTDAEAPLEEAAE